MGFRVLVAFMGLAFLDGLGSAEAANPPSHRHSVAAIIGNKTDQGRIPEVAYAHRDADAACGFANVHDRDAKGALQTGWTAHDCDDGAVHTTAAGSARTDGACEEAVERGGSWIGSIGSVRTANRAKPMPDLREYTVGMRVLRELD